MYDDIAEVPAVALWKNNHFIYSHHEEKGNDGPDARQPAESPETIDQSSCADGIDNDGECRESGWSNRVLIACGRASVTKRPPDTECCASKSKNVTQCQGSKVHADKIDGHIAFLPVLMPNDDISGSAPRARDPLDGLVRI